MADAETPSPLREGTDEVDDGEGDREEGALRERARRVGLVGGPLLFALSLVLPGGMPPGTQEVLGVTLWMAAWWMTEAAPIPVTSLLPIVLFPLLGVMPVDEAAAPYGNPIVFLFLGGFLLAIAIEASGLHRRVALRVLERAGGTGPRLVLAFMVATAFLSMWVSNTATALMMLPLGTSVVALLHDASARDVGAGGGDGEHGGLATALMLGIAYAASVGGLATLVGTPPNAILAGVARESLGVEVGFATWMAFGLPVSIVLLAVTWFVLVRLFRPEVPAGGAVRGILGEKLRELEPLGRRERRVLGVFLLVAGGWVLRPFLLEGLVPGLTDTGIAILGGLLVLLLPAGEEGDPGGPLVPWDEAAAGVPWGVLLLFGGGFSLANAFQVTGFDALVGSKLAGLGEVPPVLFILLVGLLVVALGEVASNTAQASILIPVAAGLGPLVGGSPLGLMAAVAAFSSVGFILPVATPPNAVLYGSGYVRLPAMARAGIRLDVVGILVVAAAVGLWLPVAWGL